MSVGTSPIHIVRQHISLVIQDNPLEIKGFTDIEISSSSSIPPDVIFLHSRQLNIESVSVNNQPLEYEYFDSSSAFLFKDTFITRDTAQFSAIAKVVNESPDLYIKYNGSYPVTIHIEFNVRSDSTAIVQYNGIIFTDNRVDGPSGWFPCLDSIAQRSFFSLSVTFHQSYVCIGPGEGNLVNVDQQQRTNTMLFKLHFPVTAKGIGFALGHFVSQTIGNDCFAYFTGVSDEAFMNTLSSVPKILQTVNEKFGFEDNYYPTISFVSIPVLTEIVVLPGVIFVPSNMNIPLGNVNVIQVIIPKLIEAIIGLYVYYLFPVNNLEDSWLPIGLAGFFADIVSSKFFSESFKLNRRWDDINWLMSEDIFPSIVLSAIDPATGEPFRDSFLKTKAKLLVNMFATSMKNSDVQLILLMRPLFKFCFEQPGFVTERFFSDLIRFCPNIKFDVFRKQWISSNGFPIFTYNFTNDNRHNSMKLVLAQTPSTKTNVPFFTGQILVHLRDLDQPYEFQFPIENQIQLQQISYFAHKRKTKKKKFVYENRAEKTVFVHHAIMWLIIDAQLSWICRVRPRLPLFMLLYQIELLHSVYAQHEAISSLEDFKDNEEAIKALEGLLNNTQVFYAVRGHAAHALAKFNHEQTDFKHMTVLLEWYQKEFFTQNGKDLEVKPHDFSDIPRHFVQLEVIKSLSIIRNGQNYTPDKVVNWLIKIMQGTNNNTNNMYDDDYFNACVILALGRIRPEEDNYYLDASNLILSKLSLHASIPSYCNIITNAGYQALTAIALKTSIVEPNISEMRAVVLKNTNYYECRSSVFRDLLFLALIDKGISYAQLISDIKCLAVQKFLEVAALCLREIYRFILNTPHITDKDKFETYLLSIPDGITKDDIIKKITTGPKALEVAETFWEILSVHGKNHKILRSEALRTYSVLYGDKIPPSYLGIKERKTPLELTPERSFGMVINIDTPRFVRSSSSSQLQTTKNVNVNSNNTIINSSTQKITTTTNQQNDKKENLNIEDNSNNLSKQQQISKKEQEDSLKIKILNVAHKSKNKIEDNNNNETQTQTPKPTKKLKLKLYTSVKHRYSIKLTNVLSK